MGISPVVAGDAYDHKGSARPAVGDNEVGKGLSVFLRVPKKILSAVEQFDVETRDSHKIMCAGFDSFAAAAASENITISTDCAPIRKPENCQLEDLIRCNCF
jgi:hypothetical protein